MILLVVDNTTQEGTVEMKRMRHFHGRKGFTKKARGILGEPDHPAGGGMESWGFIPIETLREVADTLPVSSREMRQSPKAPSIDECIGAEDVIGVRVYRIIPERPDERVQVEGVYLPLGGKDAHPEWAATADEECPVEIDGWNMTRLWWD